MIQRDGHQLSLTLRCCENDHTGGLAWCGWVNDMQVFGGDERIDLSTATAWIVQQATCLPLAIFGLEPK